MNIIDCLISASCVAIALATIYMVRAVVRGKVRDDDINFTPLARAVAEGEKKARGKHRGAQCRDRKEVEDGQRGNGLKDRFAAWYSRFWDGLGSSYMEEKGVATDPVSSDWSREYLMRPVADILFASGAYAKLNTVKALASLVLAACVAATVCVLAGAPVAVKLGAFGVAVLTAVGSWVMYRLGFDGENSEIDAGMTLFDNGRDMRWLLDTTEEGVSGVTLNDAVKFGMREHCNGDIPQPWFTFVDHLVKWFSSTGRNV